MSALPASKATSAAVVPAIKLAPPVSGAKAKPPVSAATLAKSSSKPDNI